MRSAKYDFKDKVAFVTGASTGIGRATALCFVQNGAAVAVVDVNDRELQATAKMLTAAGGRVLAIHADVSVDSQVRGAVDKTMASFGRLDFAFNNAGIEGAQAPTDAASEANWDRVIDVNLKGVWLCMKYQLPIFLKQKSGSIVNCSSIAGVVGFPGILAYVASKHGVIGLTQTAALEYATQNIRVNAVCPGVIQTPMIERFAGGNKAAQDALAASEPVGRMGQPEEIASAVMWLSSEESSFVTGHSLVVDGGWVAR